MNSTEIKYSCEQIFKYLNKKIADLPLPVTETFQREIKKMTAAFNFIENIGEFEEKLDEIKEKQHKSLYDKYSFEIKIIFLNDKTTNLNTSTNISKKLSADAVEAELKKFIIDSVIRIRDYFLQNKDNDFVNIIGIKETDINIQKNGVTPRSLKLTIDWKTVNTEHPVPLISR